MPTAGRRYMHVSVFLNPVNSKEYLAATSSCMWRAATEIDKKHLAECVALRLCCDITSVFGFWSYSEVRFTGLIDDDDDDDGSLSYIITRCRFQIFRAVLCCCVFAYQNSKFLTTSSHGTQHLRKCLPHFPVCFTSKLVLASEQALYSLLFR